MTGERDYLLIGSVGALTALAALTWGGGALACLEIHGTLPHADVVTGLRSLGRPGNPGVAWHGLVGPAGLYWANVGLLTVVVVVGGLWFWTRRVSGGTGARDGFASSRTVRAAAGAASLAAKAAILRPSCSYAGPSQLGIRLGSAGRTACWASIEDSIVILGPPRSGKGLHLVIPAILDAPGAVVTTSTRPDNLHATLDARRRHGPVAVFDPQGLAAQPPPDDEARQNGQPAPRATTYAGEHVLEREAMASIRWSPLTGCADPAAAMARARALCAGHAQGVENASFWAQQCESVVRCLLHAGALEGRSPADLLAWSLSPLAAEDAAAILRENPRAVPAWSTALDTILGSDSRQRDSVWAVVSNAFAALADPNVLAAVTPAAGEEFDAESFLLAGGTLYLLGSASGAQACATLVNALIEDIVETARKLAARAPGGRLDPPLALVLDEAANYPLPSLLSLMSEGGGSGISAQVVLQSMAQARAKWGNDEAAALWDAAIVKVVLGGSANATDLRDLSALAGTRTETVVSYSFDADGRRTSSTSTQDRPVLDIGLLRTLPFGHALLLLRSIPPVRMTLQPWTTRTSLARAEIQRRRTPGRRHR